MKTKPDPVKSLIVEIRRHLKALLKEDLTTRSMLDLQKLWQIAATVRLDLPLSGESKYLVALTGKDNIQASSTDDSSTSTYMKAGEKLNMPPGVGDVNTENSAAKEYKPHTHIHVHIPQESYNFSGASIANSVVGAHMQKVTNTIQEISPERAGLTNALEELQKLVTSLLDQLPHADARKAAANLEFFTQEATKMEPLTSVLTVTSDGLIEATKTIAIMAGPIVGIVLELRKLLGF